VHISLFNNYKKTIKIKDASVQELFGLIQKEITLLLTEAARAAGKGSEKFDLMKSVVYGFTPHGTFQQPDKNKKGSYTTGANNKHLIELSGVAYLDVDNNEKFNPEFLKSIPCLFAYWRSISGKGYSLLFKVDKTSIKGKTVKETAEKLNKVIASIANTYDIPFDSKARSLNRGVCIPADPDIYINYSAKEFIFVDNENENDFSVNDSGYNTDSLGVHKHSEKKEKIYSGAHAPLADEKDNLKKWSYAKESLIDSSWSDDEPYRLYPEPIKEIDLYPKRIYGIGKRNSTLLSIAAKCIGQYTVINEMSREETFKFFAKHNNYCENPLEKKQLQQIFNSVWKQYEAGDLKVPLVTRYGEVNPNYPLSVEKGSTAMSKKKAAGMLSAAVREQKGKGKGRTVEEIRKAIDAMKLEARKITKESLAEIINKSPDTIKRNWKPFMAEIQKYNDSLSGTKNKHVNQAKSKPVETSVVGKMNQSAAEEPASPANIEQAVEEISKPEEGPEELTLEERTELVFQYLKTIRFKSLHVVKTKAEAVERSLYLEEVDGDLHIFRLGQEGYSDPLNGEEMYRKWLREQAGIVEEVEELPF
jgi:hypothetical protein